MGSDQGVERGGTAECHRSYSTDLRLRVIFVFVAIIFITLRLRLLLLPQELRLECDGGLLADAAHDACGGWDLVEPLFEARGLGRSHGRATIILHESAAGAEEFQDGEMKAAQARFVAWSEDRTAAEDRK